MKNSFCYDQKYVETVLLSLDGVIHVLETAH